MMRGVTKKKRKKPSIGAFLKVARHSTGGLVVVENIIDTVLRKID